MNILKEFFTTETIERFKENNGVVKTDTLYKALSCYLYNSNRVNEIPKRKDFKALLDSYTYELRSYEREERKSFDSLVRYFSNL